MLHYRALKFRMQKNLLKEELMTKLRGKLYPLAPWAAGVVIGLMGTPAGAVDLKSSDGNWTFSIAGNVNVHYIYSKCESSPTAVDGGLACTGTASGSNVSNVGNGLLPAAFTFGVATTQGGYDLSAHLGLFPGIATNDGGSPNLEANGAGNTALGTTGLDVRQVYLTFGNKDMGTFLFGRNFGLFGFDAIIADMTLPGVGAAGSASGPAPANTTLGSIGLGYIYVDTLAQMDYTTPDFSGVNLTLGIFDPITALAGGAGTPAGKKAPGFHGKVAWTLPISNTTKFYGSATFISQKQNFDTGPTTAYSYNGTGFDVFAKINVEDFEAFAYYYHGSGLGTTGLFIRSADALGNTRDSDGFLVQATYKVGQVKFGVNYGESKLDLANAADSPALVSKNRKVTGGVYDSLTKNLTLLAEVTDVKADAHNGNSNKSINFNVGAFLSF
jgi:predicted porin